MSQHSAFELLNTHAVLLCRGLLQIIVHHVHIDVYLSILSPLRNKLKFIQIEKWPNFFLDIRKAMWFLIHKRKPLHFIQSSSCWPDCTCLIRSEVECTFSFRFIYSYSSLQHWFFIVVWFLPFSNSNDVNKFAYKSMNYCNWQMIFHQNNRWGISDLKRISVS